MEIAMQNNVDLSRFSFVQTTPPHDLISMFSEFSQRFVEISTEQYSSFSRQYTFFSPRQAAVFIAQPLEAYGTSPSTFALSSRSAHVIETEIRLAPLSL
jgi:hypothetical protein